MEDLETFLGFIKGQPESVNSVHYARALLRAAARLARERGVSDSDLKFTVEVVTWDRRSA